LKNIVFLKLQQWDFHKQHDKPTLSNMQTVMCLSKAIT